MRFWAFGFVIILVLISFSSFSCEKGEIVDPFPPRELEVVAIIEKDGDFSCGDLNPLDGDPIPNWQLICGNEAFTNADSCGDFALWIMEDIDELNERLGTNFNSSQCNVNFESEMVIGVCARRYCGEELEKCDSKRVSDTDVHRLLQAYTCKSNEGKLVSENYFAVVPKTGRNITIEIHRYLAEEEQ